MHHALRPVLAVLFAAGLLLSGCGDDGDEGSSDTTPAAQGDGGGGASPDSPYCKVARETQDAAPDEIDAAFQEQLAVAPEELKSDLEILSENVEAFQNDPSSVPAEAQAALSNVIAYQSTECGIAPAF